MPKQLKIKRYPLSSTARAIILLAALINVVTWLAIVYYYPALPNTIPTHFNASGTPTSYGDKIVLLIVPAVLSAIIIIILLVLRYRYTLLERYPYLLNLPAFTYRHGLEKNSATHGIVINRVFTVHTLSALYISILCAVIVYALFSLSSHVLSLLLPAILIVVVVLVATVLLVYRSIYRSFAVK
ncbi:MAG: DUF1648 domain-containing protein [Candidatus Micrarchaeales archaeon]|nr:DUF1648 domain-containing protein [Candidatus Micrarchaeales archaeon]